MLGNSTKAVLLMAGIVGITAGALRAGSAVAPGAVQQKAAIKKSIQKPKASKADSASEARSRDSSITAADSLRRDSLMHKTFTFKVVTEPESVAVLLDDSIKGMSPCSLSGVTPGNHVLTLKKIGYYLKKAEISVDSASSPELSFVLLKPAFLSVISDPAGAAVSLDGKNEGITPCGIEKVKPGDHSVRVELRQYTVMEQTVSLKNGGCDTVRLTLEHTAAYRDSVSAALQAAEKLHKERFTFSIVSAVFCLCAILLVVVEANSQ